MKTTSLLALTCVAAAVLSGCAEMPSNAPVDDRSASWQRSGKPAPQAAQDAPVPDDPPGFYTVRRGDTLSRIAQKFNQNWRDVADWNSLSDPNKVEPGQRLRVQPPEGPNVGSVPVDTGMEVRPLESSPPPKTAAEPLRPTGGLKAGPQGQKVAYSDQAWADFQRGDSVRPSEPARKQPAAMSPAARFIWPTEGKVMRGFDASRKGIEIAGQAGQPVMTVGDGTVLYAKNMRGYGNLVIIDHGEGMVSAYGHNKTILVKEGQTVTRGQRIAEMGDSDADSVRLHFEIRQLGKPIDPISLLPSR